MSDTAVLILAAGKGERMRSEIPKVLHSLGGKTLLAHVVETAKTLHPKKIVVLVGHKASLVKEKLAGEKIVFAHQKNQLGTAHAVLCGLESLKKFRGGLLILSGDVPLLKPETLRKMQDLFVSENPSVVLLTGLFDDPSGYGRIVRNRQGEVVRIVEEKEAQPHEKEIK